MVNQEPGAGKGVFAGMVFFLAWDNDYSCYPWSKSEIEEYMDRFYLKI